MLGGSVSKQSLPCLRFQGAPQWHGEPDPVYVETCSCAGRCKRLNSHVVSSPYESGLNLHCGALGSSSRAKAWNRKVPSAVCSVACLEWDNADERTTRLCYGHSILCDCSLKYFLQKRLRDGLTVVENTWAVRDSGVGKGLQCGLSGNRAAEDRSRTVPVATPRSQY